MSHSNLQLQSFLCSHCQSLSFVHTSQRHGRDRMVVRFPTTWAIRAYHH